MDRANAMATSGTTIILTTPSLEKIRLIFVLTIRSILEAAARTPIPRQYPLDVPGNFFFYSRPREWHKSHAICILENITTTDITEDGFGCRTRSGQFTSLARLSITRETIHCIRQTGGLIVLLDGSRRTFPGGSLEA